MFITDCELCCELIVNCVFLFQDDVDSAVETYRAFLSRYPYCYGYWKKFADYVKKRTTLEECEAVSFQAQDPDL